MPLKKLIFKPGINREVSNYTSEGGWYDCDKVRFRYGFPEKIGGWISITESIFKGVCRSLFNWITLGSSNLIGVGTNSKFYVENRSLYTDVTPLRVTTSLSNPFVASNGSAVLTVTAAGHGATAGDFVTFTNAQNLYVTGGNITAAILNANHEITEVVNANTYLITLSVVANSNDTLNGGTDINAYYEIQVKTAYQQSTSGWGSSTWGSGPWGLGQVGTSRMGIWNQTNFGEDLLYGRVGEPLYYMDAISLPSPTFTVTIASPAVVSSTVPFANGEVVRLFTTGALPTGLLAGSLYYVANTSGSGLSFNLTSTYGGATITTTGTQSGTHSFSPRGYPISSIAGASDTPLYQNYFLVSDTSYFVICFGVNEIGSTFLDPMLIRWSDQQNVAQWTPSATNQAGGIRLSNGSEIITAIQVRQEILIWTDTSLYSMQYVGPPFVWALQLMASNLSIMGIHAAAVGSGITFWMGIDKFYAYDGRLQTLRCDVLRYVYDDINLSQFDQVFATSNEGFNEIWWFYCSSTSTTIDRYVTYNYVEQTWYYGNMARTAWIDTPLRNYPVATTYDNKLLYHEYGVDDQSGTFPAPIESYITSSQFDIDDGDSFSFIKRVLPDVTFAGSTSTESPKVTMYFYPAQNSGSGNTTPASIGGASSGDVDSAGGYAVNEFTGQIYIRVRGRQMSLKIASNDVGTAWQLGAPRIDIRPDGRR